MGALCCGCLGDDDTQSAKASLNPGAGSYRGPTTSSYGATSDIATSNGKASQQQQQREARARSAEARLKAGQAAQDRVSDKRRKSKKEQMIARIKESDERQAQMDAMIQKRKDEGKPVT